MKGLHLSTPSLSQRHSALPLWPDIPSSTALSQLSYQLPPRTPCYETSPKGTRVTQLLPGHLSPWPPRAYSQGPEWRQCMIIRVPICPLLDRRNPLLLQDKFGKDLWCGNLCPGNEVEPFGWLCVINHGLSSGLAGRQQSELTSAPPQTPLQSGGASHSLPSPGRSLTYGICSVCKDPPDRWRESAK